MSTMQIPRLCLHLSLFRIFGYWPWKQISSQRIIKYLSTLLRCGLVLFLSIILLWMCFLDAPMQHRELVDNQQYTSDLWANPPRSSFQLPIDIDFHETPSHVWMWQWSGSAQGCILSKEHLFEYILNNRKTISKMTLPKRREPQKRFSIHQRA